MIMNLHAFKLGGRAYLEGFTKEENSIRKMREMGMPGVADRDIESWDAGWEKVREIKEK